MFANYKKIKIPEVRENNFLGKILSDCLDSNLRIFDASIYSSIAVYSDYSGKTNGDYNVYSFLVVPLDGIGNYFNAVERVRAENGFKNGELTFKKMGQNERMLNVANEALRLSNNLLPGVMINFCVDKDVKTFFADNERTYAKVLKERLISEGMPLIHKNNIEYTLRIIHFFSYVSSVFLESKHIVFWMSDNDDDFFPIANEGICDEFLSMIYRVLPLYQGEPFKFLNFNVQGQIDAKWHRELVSLVDISAAGVVDILTSNKNNMGIKEKTKVIAKWLSIKNGLGLQKINLFISKNNGEVCGGNVDFKYAVDDEDLKSVPYYFR